MIPILKHDGQTITLERPRDLEEGKDVEIRSRPKLTFKPQYRCCHFIIGTLSDGRPAVLASMQGVNLHYLYVAK